MSLYRHTVNFLCVIVAACSCVIGTGYATDNSPKPTQTLNCGVTSALALAQMHNRSASAEVIDRLAKEYPQTIVSLSDIKKIAASLGIDISGAKATLGELLETQRPAIIHLTNPDHFVLLMDGSKEQIRLLEGPDQLTVVPRVEMERRFDGYALIPQTDESEESPRVQFEETDFHFGVSGIGQTVERVYRFRNTGKSDLTVTISGTSCGCTGALLVGAGEKVNLVTLKPGQESSIRVSYTLQSAGPSQQMVALKTNDPYRPLVYLTLRGSAPQDLFVSPSSLHVITSKNQPLQRNFTVVGPPAMDIVAVTTDDPLLQATYELKAADEVRNGLRIEISG